MKYFIVEFTEEERVEVIPSSWLAEDHKSAVWPSKLSVLKVKTAIKGFHDPTTVTTKKYGWTTYPVKVITGSGSYRGAESKAEAAQYTSNLTDTSNDENALDITTRHFRKRKLFDVHSENDSEEETSMKLGHKAKRSKWERPVLQNFNSEGTNIDNNSPNFIEATRPTKVINEKGDNVPSHTYTTASVSGNDHPMGSPSSFQLGCKHCGSELHTKVLEKIFGAIESMKVELKEMKRSVNNCTTRIAKLYKAKEVLTVEEAEFFNSSLPILNETELQTLEENLKSREMQDKLASQLSLVGGTNERDVTRNVMKKIFSKAISLQYSVCGRKGKKVFKDLTLYKVVQGAVRLVIPAAKEDEILKVVGTFLAGAKDREGGRKLRNMETIEGSHETNESSDTVSESIDVMFV